MSGKISVLVIKVDLSCTKCYDKIRQVLCKYHCQIQTKIFDDKNNTVTITGFFHPCKFAKKLRCKAGKAIISIEELKPKSEEPKSKPAPPETKKPAASPSPAPAEDPPKVEVVVIAQPQPQPPPQPETKPAPPAEPAKKQPEPVPQPVVVPYFIPTYPQPGPPQFGTCCGPCYQGYGGGPCHEGYGVPPPPPPQPFYDYDYYGKRQPPPCDCGCGGYRRCTSRCETYFSDENATSCNIM